MSVSKYSYRGEGVPRLTPRRLSSEDIEYVITSTLQPLLLSRDPVVDRQVIELGNVMRRDLRRIEILDASWLDKLIDRYKQGLLNAVVMTHTRIGTKAAGAIVADLAQQIISEKRGGSGKESGLSQIAQFEELVGVSKNRKIYHVWAYPTSTLSTEERDLLRRELIDVSLSDLVVAGRLGRYDRDVNLPPAWYNDVGVAPIYGQHYELEFDPLRLVARGVLPSQLINSIMEVLDKEVRSETTIVVSPYTEGRADIYFSNAINNPQLTSTYGSRIYTFREQIHIKGTRGVTWINEELVSPRDCVRSIEQLSDGTWVVYYSLLPALELCMSESDFLRWFDLLHIPYTVNGDMMEIRLDTDPSDAIRRLIDSKEGSEYRFDIEYSGKDIEGFFLDERFDTSRVITNSPQTNEKMLGVAAARLMHATELFALAKQSVKNLDGRHIELVCDIMASTGRMTGISVKGMERRGADAISRFTSRQPEKVIREEAVTGATTPNINLASSRFIGNQSVAIGSTVWTNVENPLAGYIGQQATPDYIASIRGKRIPAPVVKNEAAVREREVVATPSRLERPAVKRSTLSRRPVTVVRRID